jgi:SpoVK/Ycf46/Vps4 family AAA+-type ATPase
MILIDEADSLAQSRGSTQTHHEDDAGVNTLIQRIDRLRGKPIGVLFATNLAQSLDSAILRRAAATYHFDRPEPEQRTALFRRILANTNIDEQTITRLVSQTEPRTLPGFGPQKHRFTYSDLSQRLLPKAIEEAMYEQQALSSEHLLRACQTTLPTPEMRSLNQTTNSTIAPPEDKTREKRPTFHPNPDAKNKSTIL